jgi:hypothetical protein
MSYSTVMWIFIGCGLRDLVPLLGSVSVLGTVRVYTGGPSAVVSLLGCFLVVWFVGSLCGIVTKGTRSRNPQPINIYII